MEKSAKSFKDPALNKIVQEKAAWNRLVSSFINDLIHFKKSINDWPSKFYKERTRITQPSPIDLSSIINKMMGEFQEIATQGNSIITERKEFALSRTKRHSENVLSKLDEKYEQPSNLSQQLGKGAFVNNELSIFASDMSDKYDLEVLASNPFSRFVTRLFNPKFGFGQEARIRRLRMTMLDYCVKSYKELKKLHKEVVKSSKSSIGISHKLMMGVWNYWNAVNRLFTTFKTIKPEITETITNNGGEIENPEKSKKNDEESVEHSEPPELNEEQFIIKDNSNLISKLQDYRSSSVHLGKLMNDAAFKELHSIIETIVAAPKNKKLEVMQNSNIENVYNKALLEANNELGTSGNSFKEIVSQIQKLPKTAQLQRYLGKLRHQLIPGISSGQRLEIYNLILQVRQDLDQVMSILEKGFDQEQLTVAINTVNREMTGLRTMMRSLYFSEKPEESPSMFF